MYKPAELRSEIDHLRSIRRRSVSQQSPLIDPDLPDENRARHPPPSMADHAISAFPPPALDPAHDPNPDLFWLPARLHPEIAPQEFKAFIQEATKPENLLRRTNSALGSRRRSHTEDDPGRSNTISSGLGRKKSMLSHVYNPSADSPEPPVPPLTPERTPPQAQVIRGHSMSSRSGLGRGLEGLESLTINDLQRLESLVLKKPVGPSTDLVDSSEGNVAGFGMAENRIRAVLRRSMSMGGAAALSSGDEGSDDQSGELVADDSPLISRGPGHIIRRTARTKVRKSALPGDGGGHRFPATRRPKIVTALADEPGSRSVSLTSCTSDDSAGAETVQGQRRVSNMSMSTDEHEGSLEGSHSSHAHRSLSPPTAQQHSPHAAEESVEDAPTPSLESSSRPVSSDSNSSLLDAYIGSPEPEHEPAPVARASQPASKLQMNSSSDHLPIISPPGKTPFPKVSPLPVPSIAKGKKLAKSSEELFAPKNSRASTPVSSRPAPKSSKTSPPTLVSSSSSPPPPKEKKRAWGAKLGLSDKSKKSTGAPKPSKSGTPGPSSSSSSSGGGFLSGLFGSKSKKPDQHSPTPTPPPPPPTVEPSQTKAVLNPTASGGFIQGRYTSFYRLPIHVERAVYRLSHIKLANPRRALYEQVLISNLMFWYLGVINRGQQPQSSTTPIPPISNVNPNGQNQQQQQKKKPLINGFEDEDEDSEEDDEDDDEDDEDESEEDAVIVVPNDDQVTGETDRGGGSNNNRRVPGGGGVVKKKVSTGTWLGGINGSGPSSGSINGGEDQQLRGKQKKGKSSSNSTGSIGRKTVGSSS